MKLIKDRPPYLLFIFLLIVLAVFLWMLTGCNPTRKAFDRVQRSENSQQLSEVCAVRYPSKDSIVKETITKFDTIYAGEVIYDTITKGDTVYVTKTVPKMITKTVTQIKEVYKENTAKVQALEGQLSQCYLLKDDLTREHEQLQSLAKRYKSQRNKAYLWWLIIAAVAVGWTFRKPILAKLV